MSAVDFDCSQLDDDDIDGLWHSMREHYRNDRHAAKRQEQRARALANRTERRAPLGQWERFGVPLPHVPTFEVERTGMEWVYVFSFEDNIELAKLKNQSPRVKIGRTDGNPYRRIAEQVNSATPGAPIPVMIIRCASSRELEKQLHRHFAASAVRGGGVEWFQATPREIVEVMRSLRPAMVQIQ